MGAGRATAGRPYINNTVMTMYGRPAVALPAIDAPLHPAAVAIISARISSRSSAAGNPQPA
ncbi:MAG: hypothetical protein JWM10_1141 [Myxococcaceae bacterium]|nr:hypothetical protein [Myxococcaceae bacterium]